MTPRNVVLAGLLAGSALAPLACDTPVSTSSNPGVKMTAPSSASASAKPPEKKGPEYTENDFVESERNRDPFHSFVVQTSSSSKPVVNQRSVELSQYSIDELKLVALVQGPDRPRAMFLDPTGKGQIVYRGMYLCRPDIVHVGGPSGHEYEVNWRVDRIREGDIVLIRQDDAHPEIPPATRVIPLHPEADKEVQAGP